MTKSAESDSAALTAIAAYKAILQDVLERRPSGTRQKLAKSLGKARSFISQITSSAYPVPIPAQHLAVIFESCHFSTAEKQRFLTAYKEAHPRRLVGVAGTPRHRTIHIIVPDLGDPARNQELHDMVQDFANKLQKLACSLDVGRPPFTI